MLGEEKLQIAGPLLLIALIMSGEVAGHALSTWPASSLLWYLDLEVFPPFPYEPKFIVNGLGPDGVLKSIWLAGALFSLICIGTILKARLPIAIASNISFIFAAVALYQTLSVDFVRPSVILMIGVFFATIISSSQSHRAYWREIFS
jgi:hypothetical protein